MLSDKWNIGSSFNHVSLFQLCLYIDRTISLEGDPPRPTARGLQDHEVNKQDLQSVIRTTSNDLKILGIGDRGFGVIVDCPV